MTSHSLLTKEYKTVNYVSGPLIFAENVKGVSFGETAKIILPNGEERTGQVLDISQELAVIQVFEGTSGIDDLETGVRFTGEPPKVNVSFDMLGRVFDGVGNPRDGGPNIISEESVDITGTPINPYARDKPTDFIQTGMSAIDGLNTLVRGKSCQYSQALVCRQTGLPPKSARQAKVLGGGRTLPSFSQRWALPSRKHHSL